MKKALIVAIGPAYPPPYPIYDPPNNRANWLNTLAVRGFGSVVQLTEAQATRPNILAAMNAFVASLGPQDSGAFIFTGHGGKVIDWSGEEADWQDECIASVEILPICDDAMQSIFSQTDRPLDVVLDCCYPDNSNIITKRLWAAGTESQYAHTGTVSGVKYSIFSLYLCWALRAYPTKTASEIMAIVAYYVTAKCPDQTPQLIGIGLSQVPF